MASPEKIQEFLEASKTKEQYLMIMEQMMNQLGAHFSQKGNKDGIMAAELSKRTNKVLGEKIFKFMEDLYVDIFTDEELDELIKINSSPTFVRLREMAPELSTKTLSFFLENQESWMAEMEQIAIEVEEEFNAKENPSVH